MAQLEEAKAKKAASKPGWLQLQQAQKRAEQFEKNLGRKTKEMEETKKRLNLEQRERIIYMRALVINENLLHHIKKYRTHKRVD